MEYAHAIIFKKVSQMLLFSYHNHDNISILPYNLGMEFEINVLNVVS